MGLRKEQTIAFPSDSTAVSAPSPLKDTARESWLQPAVGLQRVSTSSGQVVGTVGGSGPEPVGDGDRNDRLGALGVLGGSPPQSFQEPEPSKTGGQPRRSEQSERSKGLPGVDQGGAEGGIRPSVLKDRTTNDTTAWAEGCPNALLLEGSCDEHCNIRYRWVPCRRRGCEVCGPIGRWRIAERIGYGVEQFWPCAWLVLSFRGTEAENPSWKPQALKRLSVFIRALRKEFGVWLEYAATYELTERGRLHINLIIGPWTFIPQRRLCNLWGARVWVQRVKDRRGMGREAAKSYDPRYLGCYVAKLEQAVPDTWGNRCSFSRGWPKLLPGGLRRCGSISWEYADANEMVRTILRVSERELIEVIPGEWAYRDEDCECFQVVSPDVGPGTNKEDRMPKEPWSARDGP